MESPYSQHFDTNYGPSEGERRHIEEILSGPRQKVAELDRKIAELLIEREVPTRYIQRHTRLLHPIRTIPVEILEKIFLSCADVPYPFPHPWNRSHWDTDGIIMSANMPMLLTFVCRSWRQIAVDLPPLWDNILIDIPKPMRNLKKWKAIIQGRTQAVRLWLSRASNDQVTISVISPESYYGHSPPPDDSLDDDTATLIKTIIKSSPQWRKLRLEVSIALLPSFLNIPTSSTPNLRYIDLRMPRYESFEEDEYMLEMPLRLISGPLTGLSLRSYPGVGIMAMPIQWAELTEIHFNRMEMMDYQVIDLFRECTSLKRCTINFLSCKMPRPFWTDICLPKLEYLFIDDFEEEWPNTNFARSLELPALNTLEFDVSCTGFKMLAIILKQAPAVRILFLKASSFSMESLSPVLINAPNLEALTLKCTSPQNQRLTDDFLAALTPSTNDLEEQTGSTNGILCPKLQSITIDQPGELTFSVDAISKFVEARRERSNGFHSLLIRHRCRGQSKSSDDGSGCLYEDIGMTVLERLRHSVMDIDDICMDIRVCDEVGLQLED